MSEDNYTLFCLIENISADPFPIDINPNKTVGHLRKCIKNENAPDLNDINPSNLMLWKVDVSEVEEVDLTGLTDGNVLKSNLKISSYWKEKPSDEGCIQVYIRIQGK